MKIRFEELESVNKNATSLDVCCHKAEDLSGLADFKNLHNLQIRTFKGGDLAFLKELPALKILILENVVPVNGLNDLGSLEDIEELTLQTPVGWDGSGKKVEYNSMRPLAGMIGLTELRLLDITVCESGFRPILKLKNLKKFVTNNTFSTQDFAELNVYRPDIECDYAKPYRTREIEYFKCIKCGTYKVEFSGHDLKRRTFCPNCNKKKVEELISRYEDIKRRIKAGNRTFTPGGFYSVGHD